MSAWSDFNDAYVAEVMEILERSETLLELAEGVWELCRHAPALNGPPEEGVSIDDIANVLVMGIPQSYAAVEIKRDKDGVWKFSRGGRGEKWQAEEVHPYERMARRMVKEIFGWSMNSIYMYRRGQDKMDGSIDD
ncbi:MAG: hypothetical protein ACNA8W_19180 [Bradymonadaceae bacterium]